MNEGAPRRWHHTWQPRGLAAKEKIERCRPHVTQKGEGRPGESGASHRGLFTKAAVFKTPWTLGLSFVTCPVLKSALAHTVPLVNELTFEIGQRQTSPWAQDWSTEEVREETVVTASLDHRRTITYNSLHPLLENSELKESFGPGKIAQSVEGLLCLDWSHRTHKSLAEWHIFGVLGLETWVLLARQSYLIGKFQVGERPCPKNQKWVETEDHSSGLNSGLGIHAYIWLHTYTYKKVTKDLLKENTAPKSQPGEKNVHINYIWAFWSRGLDGAGHSALVRAILLAPV